MKLGHLVSNKILHKYLKLVLVLIITVIVLKYFPIVIQDQIETKKLTKDVKKVNDVYNRLVNLTNFTFITNTKPCPDELLLITVIQSNPVQFYNREVIRKTWGRPTENNRVIFLLGTVENVSLAMKINNESSTYGDIVQGNFIDSYRNLTYKHAMGMKWVTHFCSGTRYILKSDDDVYVNLDALTYFLSRKDSPWPATDLIACDVLRNSYVIRENSKHKVTKEEFAANVYPDYCDGYVILYSQDIVSRLLAASLTTPFFWVDDVYMTGLIANKIGVERVSLSNLILGDQKTRDLISKGYKYAGEFIVAKPHISADMISKISKAMSPKKLAKNASKLPLYYLSPLSLLP